MKVIDKIKKCIIGIGSFFVAIKSKVFANSMIKMKIDPIQPELPSALYGIPRVSTAEKIVIIIQLFLIPIAMLIGLIIYLKRSKDNKITKILGIVGVIVLIVGIYLIFGDELIYLRG